MAKKRTAYENLPYLPNIVAETVCGQPYTGQEWSDMRRPAASIIATIEEKRQKMTLKQILEFADICDARCKAAYEAKAHFFEDVLKAKDGRPQLRMWLTHWMTSYLMSPERFKRDMGKTA
jgi:hypothetical protein